MSEYKKLEELVELCDQRNEDESISFEDICEKCPKKQLCDTFLHLGNLLFGDSPCSWDLKDVISTNEKIKTMLGEEND